MKTKTGEGRSLLSRTDPRWQVIAGFTTLLVFPLAGVGIHALTGWGAATLILGFAGLPLAHFVGDTLVYRYQEWLRDEELLGIQEDRWAAHAPPPSDGDFTLPEPGLPEEIAVADPIARLGLSEPAAEFLQERGSYPLRLARTNGRLFRSDLQSEALRDLPDPDLGFLIYVWTKGLAEDHPLADDLRAQFPQFCP